MAKTTKPLTSAQRGVNLFNDARKILQMSICAQQAKLQLRLPLVTL